MFWKSRHNFGRVRELGRGSRTASDPGRPIPKDSANLCGLERVLTGVRPVKQPCPHVTTDCAA